MSIMALKNRLAASGSMFILLVIATMLLQHAGAASSSTGAASSSTAESVCVQELAVCAGDAECLECFSAASGDASDEYNECVGTYEFDGSDVCVVFAAVPCCLDSVSPNDCLGNDAFVEVYTCLNTEYSAENGGVDCSSSTCSDGTVIVAGTSGVASSSPSAMLTYALGLAFLTAAAPFVEVFL